MTTKCTICEKGTRGVWNWAKLRGKYNPTQKMRKKPNLQWVTLPSGKRIRACAKCIKRLAKTK